jgi:indole-3-acetate monooxygenase
MTAATTPLAAVRELAPLISNHADLIESERRLPEPVVRALIDAGVFKLFVPRALGGSEADPVIMCQVVEELSRCDGSAGWVSMLCGSYGLLSGLLPHDAARVIYADPDAIVAGSLVPKGIARIVDGGYRVSGRWPMASGINHSTWLLAVCRLFDGDRMRLMSHGSPQVRLLFFPTSEVEIIDTWHVAGLRGTGSHDYQVQDLFVPADYACELIDEPVHTGPLYTLPYVSMATVLMGSVALGIARHALDALEELAAAKVPSGSEIPLREHAHAQTQIGEAEGLLRAGQAFLYQTLGEAWSAVRDERRLD